MFLLSIKISPLSKSYNLNKSLITVDLPAPDGPTKATFLFFGIERLNLDKILRFLYLKLTFLNSIVPSLIFNFFARYIRNCKGFKMFY